MTGRLIAIEGIDGAGTTTQAELLRDRLGLVMTREPSRGRIGLVLRELLAMRDGKAPVDERAIAMLFAADRLDHVAREIAPALAAGRHVVTDRYVLSSLAYQALYVEREFVAALNRFAPSPDLTIFVEVPVAIAEARRAGRGAAERYDDRAVQERVARNYREEADRLPRAQLVLVDGTRGIEEVYREIASAVESCVGVNHGASS